MSLDVEGNERKNLYAFAAGCLKRQGARKVLDIACGDGEGTYIIASELPRTEIVGLDINSTLIAEAEKEFQKSSIRYHKVDARQTSFHDGEFDCIVSFHTVEHFDADDQKKFLSELSRLLAPHGSLLIATPDRDVWAMQGIAGIQEDHMKELSQKEFFDLVSASGFRVESIYCQNVLRDHRSPFRPLLNFLKKIDMFKLRRLLGHAVIDRIDLKTQPVHADTGVVALRTEEKASVTVLVCKKI